MNNFNDWISNDNGLEEFFINIKNQVMRSVQTSQDGFVSFTFPAFQQQVNRPIPSQIQPMALAAGMEYSGKSLLEIWDAEGRKGEVATKAIAGSIGHWSDTQRKEFEKAMSAKKNRSLPARVGKEIGLLFEIEVFIYLLQKYKLGKI